VERYHLTLAEVEVEVVNSDTSTVRVARDALALLADLVRIRRGSKAGWYDLDAADRLRLTVKQPEPGE
jgi:hypothetical protein